jgi:hypothetical protein
MARNRVLQANERVKIGVGYPGSLDMPVLARVLKGVGLTLEVEPHKDTTYVAVYAARRIVTHDVESAQQPAKSAKVIGIAAENSAA